MHCSQVWYMLQQFCLSVRPFVILVSCVKTFNVVNLLSERRLYRRPVLDSVIKNKGTFPVAYSKLWAYVFSVSLHSTSEHWACA